MTTVIVYLKATKIRSERNTIFPLDTLKHLKEAISKAWLLTSVFTDREKGTLAVYSKRILQPNHAN